MNPVACRKLEVGHHQRIRLLPGRATADPDPHRVIDGATLDQFGKNLALQKLEHVRVTKETGHTDQQILIQHLDFVRFGLQAFGVLERRIDLVEQHPPLDASPDRG